MGRRRTGSAGPALARFFGLIAVCAMHLAFAWAVLACLKPSAVPPRADGRWMVTDKDWHRVMQYVTAEEQLAAARQAVTNNAAVKFDDRRRVNDLVLRRDRALSRLANVARGPDGKAAAAVQARQIAGQYAEKGASAFVRVESSFRFVLDYVATHGPGPLPMMGLIMFLWLVMLVFQGEGLEMDVQRRRHPMWEWLMSHPVRPAHALYADLLTPLMVNPVYGSAPLFFCLLFGGLYGAVAGMVGGVVVGLPIAVGAAMLYKGIETVALLRLTVRVRGAVLGVMSWIGYVGLLAPMLMLQRDSLDGTFAWLTVLTQKVAPAWPARLLVFGIGGEASLAQALLAWFGIALLLAGAGLWLTRRALAFGLQPPSESGMPRQRAALASNGRFGREPLFRKEILWLLRDRGAVVQIVLIPLTIGATQAFNFRGTLHYASSSWNALCGLAIICGTYFLMVLGPRSLSSEGGALWMALTWPRGLEDLLRAKARLWSRVATGVVAVVLAVAAMLYPSAWWKILLVGLGWLVFSEMMALKSVALVRAPSSSGEPEPASRSNQWVAMIGTLAFGTGVVTGAWHTAILGVVFSSLVAVAMWQRLRARLPYLFDPWSEQPVAPPTLLQATVGIALTIEVIGIGVAVATALAGPSGMWLARSIGYGVGSAIGCIGMGVYLAGRGVTLGDVVRWRGAKARFGAGGGVLAALAGGLVLAAIAGGYVSLLRLIPEAKQALDEAAQLNARFAENRGWFALAAVGFAPVAEEYLFRGLLFRTLDRELGDWRAIALSAAFFAVFHPPLAWIPVALVGAYSAWLFRTSRTLVPSVVCHLAYNAALVLLG